MSSNTLCRHVVPARTEALSKTLCAAQTALAAGSSATADTIHSKDSVQIFRNCQEQLYGQHRHSQLAVKGR